MDMDFSNLFSVAGKTVVITGGSRGIGEMLAAGFLANGAKVIISSRKEKACEETVERLKLAAKERPIVDLTRLNREMTSDSQYQGICW